MFIYLSLWMSLQGKPTDHAYHQKHWSGYMLLQIDTLSMVQGHQWCDSLQKHERGLQMTTSMNGTEGMLNIIL